MNQTNVCATPTIAALLVSMLLSFSADAYDGILPRDECAMSGTVFYYVNGILTSYKDADNARKALAEEWGEDAEDKNYEFKLSYNQTHGLFRDLLKTFRLKADEDNDDKTFWQLLGGEKPDSLNIDDLSETMASEIASRLPQAQPGGASPEEVSIHTERFRRDLEEGKKVIVIAHSQGSLLATAAVQTLWNEKWDYANNIDKINVASPSSLPNKYYRYYRESIQYVTAYDDRVINGLRFLAPDTLPGNIDNDPGIFNDPRDWLNHGFLSSYYGDDPSLEELPSRREIDYQIDNHIIDLTFPWKKKNENPITIAVYRDHPREATYAVILLIIQPVSDYTVKPVIYSSSSSGGGYSDKTFDITIDNPEIVTLPCRQDSSYQTQYHIGISFKYSFRSKSTYDELKNARVEIVVGNTMKVFYIDRPEKWYRYRANVLSKIIISETDQGDFSYTITEEPVKDRRGRLTVKTFTIAPSSIVRKIESPTLAHHARIHAIAPPAARDRASIRVRCEDREQDCKLWLECTAPKEDQVFSGWVSKAIPARGSIALDAQAIADAVGDWSGKGRIACDIGSARKFSAQAWIGSSEGTLVNTGAFTQSRRFAYSDGDRYRRFEGVDIDSIPAPGGSDESNLRIRCVDEEACTNTRLECAEDDGTLHEARLGTIPIDRVRHLQGEELAELIDHRWEGLGLSCEVQSDRRITVQALTRTAGILVNNGISNSEP
ncbi:MAG: hypothetical protein ISN28_15965 [Ectothiorhodospiraceae bacterium AqS1]|nr:hypothetical protein [Ectothiorhodospiraceae bacterium AqS1]